MKRCLLSVPVADLRSKPLWLPQDTAHRAERLSQLLEGERLKIVKREGSWLLVDALEQMRYTTSWHPYRGWVHLSEVETVKRFPAPRYVVVTPESFGTYRPRKTLETTRRLPCVFDRPSLVIDARQFLGFPYLWGGRQGTQTDCSGLIHLLYRAQGISIPRDAHDQYLVSEPINEKELAVGDLVFFGKGERMTHVWLALGPQEFLEAPQTGETIRIITDFSSREQTPRFRRLKAVQTHQPAL